MIKFGNENIESVYFGTNKISKVYKGNDLVYSASRLPSEYQEVEYIKSTGTQYIDTEIKPNQNTSIEVKGFLIGEHSNSYCGANPYFVITSGNTPNLIIRFRRDGISFDTKISAFDLHILALKKNVAFVDNNILHTFDNTSYITNYDIYLFGRNSDTGVEETNGSRIYYCKLWDNDTLIRYFIPCYRKSDNEIGMYDLVSKQFFTNQGTGAFLKGDNVWNTQR